MLYLIFVIISHIFLFCLFVLHKYQNKNNAKLMVKNKIEDKKSLRNKNKYPGNFAEKKILCIFADGRITKWIKNRLLNLLAL